MSRDSKTTMEDEFVMEFLQEAEDHNEQETLNPLDITQVKDSEDKAYHDPKETAVEVDDEMSEFLRRKPVSDIKSKIYYSDAETEKPQKKRMRRRRNIVKLPNNKSPPGDDASYLGNLYNEKLKSEIDYLRNKTKFYEQETEKLNFARTLMILQAKKARLDIERLKS